MEQDFLAYVAIVVSTLALVVTGVFGLADYWGDERWQDEQSQLLTEIRDRLPP